MSMYEIWWNSCSQFFLFFIFFLIKIKNKQKQNEIFQPEMGRSSSAPAQLQLQTFSNRSAPTPLQPTYPSLQLSSSSRNFLGAPLQLSSRSEASSMERPLWSRSGPSLISTYFSTFTIIRSIINSNFFTTILFYEKIFYFKCLWTIW
jgi:hypothetical protein